MHKKDAQYIFTLLNHSLCYIIQGGCNASFLMYILEIDCEFEYLTLHTTKKIKATESNVLQKKKKKKQCEAYGKKKLEHMIKRRFPRIDT